MKENKEGKGTECNGFLRKKHSSRDMKEAKLFIQSSPSKHFLRT